MAEDFHSLCNTIKLTFRACVLPCYALCGKSQRHRYSHLTREISQGHTLDRIRVMLVLPYPGSDVRKFKFRSSLVQRISFKEQLTSLPPIQGPSSGPKLLGQFKPLLISLTPTHSWSRLCGCQCEHANVSPVLPWAHQEPLSFLKSISQGNNLQGNRLLNL